MKIQDLIVNLNEEIEIGDQFDLELDDLVIESEVVGFCKDGILIEGDDIALSYLTVESVSDDDAKRMFGLVRPRMLINPKPTKVGSGDSSDDYEYTKFRPTGKDKKTAWAVERDVIDSNFRRVAEFYRAGKLNSVTSMLGLLDKVADRLASRENGAEEAAELKSRIAGWREKIAKAAERGSKKSSKAPAATSLSAPGTKYLDPANRPPRNRPYEDVEQVDEAKYRGKEVPLGKKLPGDVKKSKVYVRKPNGKIVKVNFGDKKMRIKKSNPKRRKSFRARHNCKNPGPRWKARYWSCKSW